MSNAAPRLNNELFQENWNAPAEKQSAQEAKISYLMVEKVTPPDYLWEKIAKRLELQDAAVQQLQAPATASGKTIALMVASAALSVALILYWLI